MQLIIFYIFAAIAVMSAIMVITRRNIVHCALFLVLTILCTAGIYILLHAEFIAAIQILLYAGSVIVMFLFVIMMVNLDVKQVCFHSAGRLFLVFISKLPMISCALSLSEVFLMVIRVNIH